MSKKFTRRFGANNPGGIHIPHHQRSGNWWRILFEDGEGNLCIIEVHLPNDSCPRKWLEERRMMLGADALAELIR